MKPPRYKAEPRRAYNDADTPVERFIRLWQAVIVAELTALARGTPREFRKAEDWFFGAPDFAVSFQQAAIMAGIEPEDGKLAAAKFIDQRPLFPVPNPVGRPPAAANNVSKFTPERPAENAILASQQVDKVRNLAAERLMQFRQQAAA